MDDIYIYVTGEEIRYQSGTVHYLFTSSWDILCMHWADSLILSQHRLVMPCSLQGWLIKRDSEQLVLDALSLHLYLMIEVLIIEQNKQ